MGSVCNVGSLERNSVPNGSLTDLHYVHRTFGIIVHQFAGSLGLESILMVYNDQLRSSRGVRRFLERE